jgi:hypothetical protein
LIPCIKLTDWIKDCLSYFDESGANAHRSPVPERPHRDLATVTLRHFLGSQKHVVGHSQLLMIATMQDRVQDPVPCEKTARVGPDVLAEITCCDPAIISIMFLHGEDMQPSGIHGKEGVDMIVQMDADECEKAGSDSLATARTTLSTTMYADSAEHVAETGTPMDLEDCGFLQR